MESLRYALAVIRRIVSVFAVAPAAAALVMFALAYQFSFYTAARDAYSYIEQFARIQQDAQPGYLTVRECHNGHQGKSASTLAPLGTCERYELKQVSVDALADEAAATLSTTYWVLVLLGLGINIAVMGPRRFFMMERLEVDPNKASPVERR